MGRSSHLGSQYHLAEQLRAGSVIFSHVNDPGFWIFKEYFNLSIPETFKSWSILETLIAVCGLAGTLILSNMI